MIYKKNIISNIFDENNKEILPIEEPFKKAISIYFDRFISILKVITLGFTLISFVLIIFLPNKVIFNDSETQLKQIVILLMTLPLVSGLIIGNDLTLSLLKDRESLQETEFYISAIDVTEEMHHFPNESDLIKAILP
jgi:hypothetical protein